VDERIELLAAPAENRMRLEDFLLNQFRGLSKIYLREIVKTERCEVNGRNENIGYRLRANDFIEIELDPTRENSMVPQDIPLDIVFEDEHLIVVNKPIGMLVHPSHRDKTGTLLNALAFHFNKGLNAERGLRIADSQFANGSGVLHVSIPNDISAPRKSAIRNPQSAIQHIRPGLIHRLDKETSGLIVAAKNARTHLILARHFEKKLVEKRYLALVDGIVADDEGTITGAIGRYVEEKRWGLKEDGREAETRFRVRERAGNKTLLELEPVTGRTNQLRIHCETIGHPIVGDTARGGTNFPRLCLHAHKLSFIHPATREKIQFQSAPDFTLCNFHRSPPKFI
jgi:23S rRNA pseudouridine1911/1915/1917 synthase